MDSISTRSSPPDDIATQTSLRHVDDEHAAVQSLAEKSAGRPTESKLLRLNEHDKYLLELAARKGNFSSCHHLMYEAIMTTAELILADTYPNAGLKRSSRDS